MFKFWINFFRLTRPLSNVKNIALILVALNNENKNHYSEAVSYFGQRKSFVIFFALLIAGLFIGYFINLYFFVFLLLAIFAIVPLTIIYLSFFNIIKTEIKKLRIFGYIYCLAVMVIILKLL